jgi:hypothetical protein
MEIKHYYIDNVDALRFDVLTVVLLKIWHFWDVTWCCWVSSSQCPEGSLPLTSVSSSSRKMGYLDCCNLRIESVWSYKVSGTTCATAWSRRLESSATLLLEPRISQNLIILSAGVVVEILVVYFGISMRSDILIVVVTVEWWRLWSYGMWHRVVRKDADVAEGPFRLTAWHHTPADPSPGTTIFPLKYYTTLICR